MFRALKFSIAASACSIFALILIGMAIHSAPGLAPIRSIAAIPILLIAIVPSILLASLIYFGVHFPQMQMFKRRFITPSTTARVRRASSSFFPSLIILAWASQLAGEARYITIGLGAFATFAFLRTSTIRTSHKIILAGVLCIVQLSLGKLHAVSQNLTKAPDSMTNLSVIDRFADSLTNSSPITKLIVYGILAICFLSFLAIAVFTLDDAPRRKARLAPKVTASKKDSPPRSQRFALKKVSLPLPLRPQKSVLHSFSNSVADQKNDGRARSATFDALFAASRRNDQ